MIIFNVANDLICKISCLLLHSLQQHRRILPHWNSAVLQYWHILSKIILIQQGMPLKFKFPEIFQSVAFFFFSQIFQFLPRTFVQGTQIPLSQQVVVELLESCPASAQGSCSRECWEKGRPSVPAVINIVNIYIYTSAYLYMQSHASHEDIGL